MFQKTVLARLCILALLTDFAVVGFAQSAIGPDDDTPPPISDESTAAPGFFKQLKNNGHFTLNGYLDFYRRALPNKKKTYNSLLLKGQTFGDLSASTTLNANAYAAYTNPTGRMRGGVSDPENLSSSTRSFDFIEMYTKTSLHSVDLFLGKTVIKNSSSEIASITDIYNPINVTGFQTPVTVGNWMIRLDYYNAKEDQITFALLPFEVGSNALSTAPTRWYINYGGYAEPLGFNLPAGSTAAYDSYRKPTANHLNFLGKYSGSRGGIDFFASAYYGSSPFAVLKTTTVANHYLIEHPVAAHLSGGISKVIENWRVYGEALYQKSRSHADDDFYEVLAGVLGKHTGPAANALGFQEIITTLEVSHDENIHHQNPNSNFYASSSTLRNTTNSVSGQVIMTVQPGLSAFFGSTYDYKDEGDAYFVGAEVYLSETFFFHLTYTAFDGKEGSPYSLCDNNKNIQLSFNWRF